MKKEVLIFCLCGVLTMSGCGQITAVPQRATPPIAATTPTAALVRTISVPEETNPPQAVPTPTAEIVPPKQTANVSPVDMQTEQPAPSLAPEGRSIAFELNPETGFRWQGYCDATVEELLDGGGSGQTKTALMERELKVLLADEAVSAEEIMARAKALGVSKRTLDIAKENLNIRSEKSGHRWFWRLPEARM